MNGVVNINKPSGLTSRDVVDLLRDLYRIKKAGHAGTLDPGATGVLLLCLGHGTRIVRFLMDQEKEYRAEITFGTATDTADSYGRVIKEADASFLTADQVIAALPSFTGEIQQVPPMVSAIRHQGKKLYQLARAGVTVERQARSVTIHQLRYTGGKGWGSHSPRAEILLTCSKGTYVRTLCEDIGNHLGCVAHMSSLVRTRVGSFDIADSVNPEELNNLDISQIIISTGAALSWMPEVAVKAGAVNSVRSGAKLFLPGIDSLPEVLAAGSHVRLYGEGELLAVAETAFDPKDNSRVMFKPVCVLTSGL